MLTDVLPQSIQTKQEIPAENAREILETSVLNTSENLFCRTCLSTQNLRPLFCNSDYNDMTHKLKLVTGLEVCLYIHSQKKLPVCYSRPSSIPVPNFTQIRSALLM